MASEHGPDFNWLKQEMDSGRNLGASGSDSSTSLAEGPPPDDDDRSSPDEDLSGPSEGEAPAGETDDEPTQLLNGTRRETMEPGSTEDEDATILDDLAQLPAPIPNQSDGSTVVMSDPLKELIAPSETPAAELQDVEPPPAAEAAVSAEAEPNAAAAEDAAAAEPAAEERPATEPGFNPFAPPPSESAPPVGDELPQLIPTFSKPKPAAASVPDEPSPPSAAEKSTTVETRPEPSAAQPPPRKPEPKPEAEAEAGRRKLILIGLASYASAVTLALLMMLMRGSGSSANPHHLESLPDVVPEASDSLSYVPVHATLAPGHTLQVGEQQRFGNILVEPIRIVKEPIEFVHYSGDPSRKRETTAPVWKLWLRITNVSDKQEIAPLDRHLLLRWVMRKDSHREYSNYYIAPQGGGKDAEVIPMYRLSSTSDWDIKDQQLGHVLKPGESFETFIPTAAEGLDALSGNLVWRFQLRKGYGPAGHGVTTIVEVPFSKENIVVTKNG